MRRSANRKKFEVTVEPVAFPVSLATAKEYLRVDGSDQDDIITQLTKAADKAARNYMGRSTINTTYKFSLDRFTEHDSLNNFRGFGGVTVIDAPVTYAGGIPEQIVLPRPPLVSVTSLTTYNTANTGTVFDSSNYFVDTANHAVVLNDGAVWPTSLRDKAAIEIVYVAGYGAASTDVPEDIIQGQLQHIADMYDCRKPTDMPETVKAFYNPHRVRFALT